MTRFGKPSACEYASYIVSPFFIFYVLSFRLLPALIAGLLVYELVRLVYPVFARRWSSQRARGMAVFVVSSVVVGIVAVATFEFIAFLKSDRGSLPALMGKMAEIIENSRAQLPAWLADSLPSQADAIRDMFVPWLREHAAELQRIGAETVRVFAHLLIGMVIGAMVSLREVLDKENSGPLAKALGERVFRLGEAFRRIVFAQIRISAVNTIFSGIYLAIVLPLFGVHLPLVKTMIAVTFLAGLLPVIGNLISNTAIFIISLAHSPMVAVTSLSYLIIIHKLEYFLNARIVGSQIKARAWELLTAMLVMESIFGLAGLAAAPICYAWLKDELNQHGLL